MHTVLDRPQQSDLLTESEAAAYLKLRPGTLSVWRCTKRYSLPWIRVGRSIRYRRNDLDAFLMSRTETPSDIRN